MTIKESVALALEYLTTPTLPPPPPPPPPPPRFLPHFLFLVDALVPPRAGDVAVASALPKGPGAFAASTPGGVFPVPPSACSSKFSSDCVKLGVVGRSLPPAVTAAPPSVVVNRGEPLGDAVGDPESFSVRSFRSNALCCPDPPEDSSGRPVAVAVAVAAPFAFNVSLSTPVPDGVGTSDPDAPIATPSAPPLGVTDKIQFIT